MQLSNLNINKIVNNIPNNFNYKEKCTEKDWINFLNKKIERKKKDMFKVIAKQNYNDKMPELIEGIIDKEIQYNANGSAAISEGDIYIINDADRAKQIEESGLAVVMEIIEKKEETKEKVENIKEIEEVKEEKKKTKGRTRKKIEK